jgi:hypothetical protein
MNSEARELGVPTLALLSSLHQYLSMTTGPSCYLPGYKAYIVTCYYHLTNDEAKTQGA